MEELHWQHDEHAAALSYRLLAAGCNDRYKPALTAHVGVPSVYVAPLVERAFALHPAMFMVTDVSEYDEEHAARSSLPLPDLIVRSNTMLYCGGLILI